MSSGELRHVVVKRGDQRNLVERRGFVREAELQALVCSSPQLLGPLGSDLTFVPIGWEVTAGPGSLDLLLIDSSGRLTLVETKLAANDESRRKVVGQVLEYASYAIEWSVEDLERFGERFFSSAHAPDDLAGLSLSDALVRRLGWEGLEGGEREAKLDALLERVSSSLAAADLRVVCGVDERIESLERIIRFLSAHSDLQIVLLQVNRFPVDDELVVLIPTLHGDTNEPKPLPVRRSVAWGLSTFIEALRVVADEEEIAMVRDIISWSDAAGLAVRWGKGQNTGRFIVAAPVGARGVSLFNVDTNGWAWIHLGDLKETPAYARDHERVGLCKRLEALLGVSLPLSQIGGSPKFRLSLLKDPAKLSGFLEVFDDVRQRLDDQS